MCTIVPLQLFINYESVPAITKLSKCDLLNADSERANTATVKYQLTNTGMVAWSASTVRGPVADPGVPNSGICSYPVRKE